jgi:3-hydroxyacyl-CoA dehydrogenase
MSIARATELVTLSRHGDCALLRIANPPVNAISPEVVQQLTVALDAFEQDRSSRALVVTCAGRTFVAGGDITSFDAADFSAQPYNRVLARLEALDRPVVAAMHGTVFGGGLELALACHWRIAQLGTQFGFPEVKLGLLPGSLGTQRLPRLVGPQLALDLIQSGRSIGTEDAREVGLIDAIVQGEPSEAGLAYARELLQKSAGGARRLSAQAVDPESVLAHLFAQAQVKAEGSPYPAASAIVRAVQASLLPFDEGEAIEARLFEHLRSSPESHAMRHLFFAQREAGKIPSLPKDTRTRTVSSVGVLGGGTMGRGIAMNFLNAGIPTVIVETAREPMEQAVAAIRSLYERTAARGRMTAQEVEARMALLARSTDDAAFSDCDLVIEAVFENMDLKKKVMTRLGQICKPGAILASNTSTLDVDELASASGRPSDVVGMHFFSPANVMRLLEVVRGASTAPDVLATVMQVARTIGKVSVVSGVCYGFIGNRMAEPYMREAEFLIMEGAQPADVDRAIQNIGMAMGPCRMLDMAGIDVGAKTVIEYGKAGGLPPDDSYRALARRMFELGRFGQKTGAGYYRYDGRKPLPDMETQRIASELAAQHFIPQRDVISQEEVFERLFFPMVNEAARILEEGIAYRPGDIDVVWTSGYGFPDHKGGPVFLADTIGLARIVERLEHYGRERGNRFGYWTPSPLLKQLAVSGRRLSDWRNKE